MNRGARATWLGLCAALGGLASAAQAGADITYPATEFEAPDQAQSSGLVRCDSGDALIGGGVHARGPYGDYIYMNSAYALNPAERTWVAFVDNYAGAQGFNYPRAIAVCDGNTPASAYYYSSTSSQVHDGSQSGPFLTCPGTDPVVSGGVQSNAAYAGETSAAITTPADGLDQDTTPDDGWVTQLNNDQDPSAATITAGVTIVCDPGATRADYRYVNAGRTVPDGEQRSLVAECPAGEPVVGGGVDSHSKFRHAAYINSSYPRRDANGTAWAGTLANYPTAEGKTLRMTVWAICRR